MDTELFKALKGRAERSVNRSRFEHSLRVTETARELCRRYQADEHRAALAGISHDMCKELPPEALLALASRDGGAITEIELHKPRLLHGRAAAVTLREEYALTDPEILEAVSRHTFGAPRMGTIARIIYIADKIEPAREQVTPEYLARLAPLSLDELLFYIADENISYLEKKGEQVAPVSYALRESLKKELAHEKTRL
ncbi:MAG: bis(5'-nucleosyl)-tetraphosphatase (symmetrical) YqeK [Spirochaetaceae bacterium]|jgi:nicotinate-nucleotide adenylyltransferase|nr:bis(5'-nucleosyl)-tetraphosphatase (symmetrical) YqeK [Spirochaetaceae bacterium]